jgi:hypothetical protein
MDREMIMQALLQKLTAPPLVFGFTADLTEGNVHLSGISDQSGLGLGLPVFGPGLSSDTVIATLAPDVTLSQPPTQTTAGASLTQGFQTIGRRLVDWAEVNDQPALFLVDGNELWPPRPSDKPAMVDLGAWAWVYSKAGQDPDAEPAIALNRILNAMTDALRPPRGFLQNLGLTGVIHARIEGDMEKDASGLLDGQVIARVPIKILVAEGFATRPLP